jgi:DNA-binding beta-propeller fold protein YncE
VPQHGAVFLRRDGKVGYVLNPCTDEVTVMQTEPPEKIDNLDAGKKVNEIVRIPAGDLVAVLSGSGARVFDMATNAVVSEAPTSGEPARIAFSADQSRFWISGGGAVHVLDGRSGKVLSTSKAFKQPSEVLVAR